MKLPETNWSLQVSIYYLELHHPNLVLTIPIRITTQANNRILLNGSRKMKTDNNIANSMLVSRNAATSTMGIWLIAQIAIP
ncbi:hypothetical protein Xbud_01644 [Xenorhabdus budapestensis]|uniref:Uncharacterized protein n=1 Tax=Xenorhabdus budapestensis TaxID=290110 RepID=A0A2D0J1Q6_XENBU|nr:hypothetical protein Xbud_01644 [Xenorhabdus budapestensis]